MVSELSERTKIPLGLVWTILLTLFGTFAGVIKLVVGQAVFMERSEQERAALRDKDTAIILRIDRIETDAGATKERVTRLEERTAR